MRRVEIGLLLALVTVFAAPIPRAHSENQPVIPVTEIEVKAKAEREENGFVERKQNEVDTQSTVTKEAINLLGGPAQSNLLKALDLMPSISVDSADPWGFTIGATSIRVRGQQAIGMGTMIEGVPVWGIQGPGPRLNMFDLENIGSITFYRGGIPSDKGLGGMDTAGLLEVGVLKPTDTFGVFAKQTAGSYSFLRSYARIDSGKLPTGTRFFISGSTTSADKWKGEGSAPDYRNHVDFGVEQRFSPIVKAELYVNYDKERNYSYKGITYAQTKDIDRYRRLDYNPILFGKPSQDVTYYGFNYNTSTNLNAMGILSIAPTESTLITVRPYYWSEDKPVWSSSTSIPGVKGTSYSVNLWENNYDRYGSVFEYKTLFAGTDVKAGYWYESFSFPIDTQYYSLKTGGSLVFNRALDSMQDGRGTIHSPYLRIQRDFFKDLHVDAGVRYLYFLLPGGTGYNSGSATPFSVNYNYDSKAYNEWLPYGGLSYSLNPNTTIYASYGRNYAMSQSWPNLFTNYLTFKTAHPTSNLSLQYFVDQFKLGTSDNYDLGLRYNSKRFYIAPVVFYAEYQNKLFSIYDPAAGQNIAQSVAKTTVYGAELEVGVNPLDNLTAFASFSYNRTEIGSNIQTAANVFVQSKGNEAPDTPKLLAKFGFIYDLYGVQVCPVAKYVDKRYGDVGNTQTVPSYWLFDLYVNYKIPPFYKTFVDLKDITAGMVIQNVFNQGYVSSISSFDYSTSGSYQVGAPRTFAFNLSAKF